MSPPSPSSLFLLHLLVRCSAGVAAQGPASAHLPAAPASISRPPSSARTPASCSRLGGACRWELPQRVPSHVWVPIWPECPGLQVFQVAYVIIKAANAPRPGNWILERSLDGAAFSPWQYYAVSDSECLTRYGIAPRRGPPTYRADDEVICTSYYSRLVPLEHGEVRRCAASFQSWRSGVFVETSKRVRLPLRDAAPSSPGPPPPRRALRTR